MERQLISIIIPTYNEEAIIAGPLRALLSITEKSEMVEIIDSDASSDGTADLVATFPVTLCRSEKGCSRQMNSGAAVARGKILYFLHADILPPETFVDDIRSAVASGKKQGASEWFLMMAIPLWLCMDGSPEFP